MNQEDHFSTSGYTTEIEGDPYNEPFRSRYTQDQQGLNFGSAEHELTNTRWQLLVHKLVFAYYIALERSDPIFARNQLHRLRPDSEEMKRWWAYRQLKNLQKRRAKDTLPDGMTLFFAACLGLPLAISSTILLIVLRLHWITVKERFLEGWSTLRGTAGANRPMDML